MQLVFRNKSYPESSLKALVMVSKLARTLGLYKDSYDSSLDEISAPSVTNGPTTTIEPPVESKYDKFLNNEGPIFTGRGKDMDMIIKRRYKARNSTPHIEALKPVSIPQNMFNDSITSMEHSMNIKYGIRDGSQVSQPMTPKKTDSIRVKAEPVKNSMPEDDSDTSDEELRSVSSDTVEEKQLESKLKRKFVPAKGARAKKKTKLIRKF